mmetsp:Transcript_42998/g.69766  ORF Transcript_42998/g.69766 Transcript_42998/m.69766 type:complete len:532 (+) Transcript_42998:77-1672(+)|eukprot:CAMPEP_0184650372 /NCGR_PEP_ID=MMETSP0308-20130426/7893_1 /TAXON_ID=38269 /ORGANISM="Gloeochaete witrockiana, Strain SAG 46.84" /LENGTH=531 /DNA_ID=CAMNT_0027083833 /DNA_START=64 /DNA_END=1659 /DNA_ORIENTATION=-
MSESKKTNASRGESYKQKEKERDVRTSNIVAAKAVADAVRTSLGPKGMDKMMHVSNGEVIITNDGATILKQMEVFHPAARMLVELSKSQDIEAGDGTTSVVVIAGSLLAQAQLLLEKGIHASTISEHFLKAADKAEEILESVAKKVDLSDRESLLKSASTSLNSKVVSQNSSLLAPLAVDAVLRVIDPATATNVDLRDVKVVKKLGGTIDDTELIDGLVFTQKISHSAGGPTRVQNAKVGLIQFCLSAPKTDIENNVVVSDYQQMDRILREERDYILKMCKKIQKAGCNVLLIQKSILRDAVNDYSLHFLAKMKILVVKDIEREDIEFICKTLGCLPIASADAFVPEKLGKADLVEEVSTSDGKIVKITGVPNPGKTVTLLVRGSNKLVLDEADRSIHDALCVIRCLVKKRYLIAGGGAPEIEIALQLANYAKTLPGLESYCFRAFADALEIIPYTLAENAGLHPIAIVTELRNKHAEGEKTAGINVRKGAITNILEENVVQPLLVTTSSIKLATETVRMILKIDDIIAVR